MSGPSITCLVHSFLQMMMLIRIIPEFHVWLAICIHDPMGTDDTASYSLILFRSCSSEAYFPKSSIFLAWISSSLDAYNMSNFFFASPIALEFVSSQGQS